MVWPWPMEDCENRVIGLAEKLIEFGGAAFYGGATIHGPGHAGRRGSLPQRTPSLDLVRYLLLIEVENGP